MQGEKSTDIQKKHNNWLQLIDFKFFYNLSKEYDLPSFLFKGT